MDGTWKPVRVAKAISLAWRAWAEAGGAAVMRREEERRAVGEWGFQRHEGRFRCGQNGVSAGRGEIRTGG